MKVLPERFSEKVDFTDTCWLWAAGKFNDGYGEYRDGEKMVRSHRFSWQYFVGEIPENLNVLHTCDVRNCVNPAHLFLGTKLENTQDMVLKGRGARGERHGSAKLSIGDVEKIKLSYASGKCSQSQLANEYGVRQAAISNIVNGKTWARKEVKLI